MSEGVVQCQEELEQADAWRKLIWKKSTEQWRQLEKAGDWVWEEVPRLKKEEISDDLMLGGKPCLVGIKLYEATGG